MSTQAHSPRGAFYLEIFLVALAVILLEISYTRVFSYKLYYYFTYLIIGIALLGLGTGGVFLALLPALRTASPARLVAWVCALAGLAVPAGYLLVAVIPLNTSQLTASPAEILKLFAVCTLLFVPFLLAGLAIAVIFGARPRRIGRLYGADLIGAGLGCALVIGLIATIGPPGCIALAGLVLAVAGLPLQLRTARTALPLSGLGVLAGVVLLAIPGASPDPVPDAAKNMAPGKLGGDTRVLHSEWSPVFRVDVIDVAPDAEILAGMRFLSHDGTIGSTVTRWDGRPESAAFFDTEALAVPFSVLEPSPSVLIVGAAGGREVLASLHFGAAEVTAVELNPVTVDLMKNVYADYSGGIMSDPRVTLVNAEGRSFVSRLTRPYDLIWLVAPDSYAAMNAATSAAFVLSESYLYTVEMILESFEHLSPDGILCTEFGDVDFGARPKRSVRYLATARAALERLGVTDFERHVMVGTTPGFFWPPTLVLLKRTPFTPDEIARFRAKLAQIDARRAGPGADPATREAEYRTRGVVWHAAGGPTDVSGAHPIHRVIALPPAELEAWQDDFAYDTSAVTDDAPFFWHFVRFRDALLGPWGERFAVYDPEEATGERVLLVLLAFAVAFAAAMLLLPLRAAAGVWRELPYKTNASLYFLALGLAFMFFEIALIQRLTLFLGYPTWSVTVTLFGILVFTGIGSLVSERLLARRNRALFSLLAALVPITLWCQFGLGPATAAFESADAPARVALAVLFVAPVGLCLGCFMPLGLASVAGLSPHAREYVAWAWATNGFASVVGSVLAVMLSMSFGFRALFALAVVVYAVGVFALSRIPETEARSSR
jgi:spermidine synthase